MVIKGAGDRAFCAGGDIRWRSIRRLDPRRAWPSRSRSMPSSIRCQRTGCTISTKPYIARPRRRHHGWWRWDLGARLASDRHRADPYSRCRRPRSASFPDVGATYVLPRLPGRARPVPRSHRRSADGGRLPAWTGLGSRYLPDAGATGRDLEAALAEAQISRCDAHRHGRGPCSSRLRRGRSGPGAAGASSWIGSTHCFDAGGAEAPCWLRLRRRSRAGWGAGPVSPQLRDQVADQPGGRVRASCAEGQGPRFRTTRCGSSTGLSTGSSPGMIFVEGVRALIVNKDNRPRLAVPADLEELSTAAEVEAYFATVAGRRAGARRVTDRTRRRALEGKGEMADHRLYRTWQHGT